MTKIKEGNVTYTIDDETKKVVAVEAEEAPVVEETEVEATEEKPAISLGSRVEVDGRLGKVFSVVDSLYGDSYGVRFDDGDFGEYTVERLSHSQVEEPNYTTPSEELVARFEEYEQLPGLTKDEIAVKEAMAKDLNVKAKALVTDSKVPFAEQVKLDQIVTATATDLMDLARASALIAEGELPKLPKYELDDDFKPFSAVVGTRGDASWLDDALEGMEVVEATDADLASEAVDTVSHFTKEQLEDEGFMTTARSLKASSLDLNDEQHEQFAKFFEAARKEQAEKLPEKTASAEAEDLDDFDLTAIFK